MRTSTSTAAGIPSSAAGIPRTTPRTPTRRAGSSRTPETVVQQGPRPSSRRYGAPMPVAALDLLATARHGLSEAALAASPAERYAAAHLAALRSAAAVLAVRARPVGRASQRNAWVLLAQAAPDLAEWAAFFAAGAGKRAAAEAGLTSAVTAREADDLLRDAETFLELVTTLLGLSVQPALSSSTASRAC